MLLASLTWLMIGSKKFLIRTVIITGSVNDGVTQSLMQLKGRNILFVTTHQLESSLPKSQSSIAALQIVKGFPDTLRVNVAVRTPLVRWHSGDQQVYFIRADAGIF